MNLAEKPKAFFICKFLFFYYIYKKPILPFDSLKCKISGKEIPYVCIIQILGLSLLGQRVCLYIHDFYPFFYLLIPPEEKNNDKLEIELCEFLEEEYGKTKKDPSSNVCIYNIERVKRKAIYGYNEECDDFLKISFLYPNTINYFASLLKKKLFKKRIWDLYEVHINYMLHFLCMKNIYGCSEIYIDKNIYFRKEFVNEINFECIEKEERWYLGGKKCNLDNFKRNKYLEVDAPLVFTVKTINVNFSSLKRETSYDIECDIKHQHILNEKIYKYEFEKNKIKWKKEFNFDLPINHLDSFAKMWMKEKKRCKYMDMNLKKELFYFSSYENDLCFDTFDVLTERTKKMFQGFLEFMRKRQSEKENVNCEKILECDNIEKIQKYNDIINDDMKLKKDYNFNSGMNNIEVNIKQIRNNDNINNCKNMAHNEGENNMLSNMIGDKKKDHMEISPDFFIQNKEEEKEIEEKREKEKQDEKEKEKEEEGEKEKEDEREKEKEDEIECFIEYVNEKGCIASFEINKKRKEVVRYSFKKEPPRISKCYAVVNNLVDDLRGSDNNIVKEKMKGNIYNKIHDHIEYENKEDTSKFEYIEKENHMENKDNIKKQYEQIKSKNMKKKINIKYGNIFFLEILTEIKDENCYSSDYNQDKIKAIFYIVREERLMNLYEDYNNCMGIIATKPFPNISYLFNENELNKEQLNEEKSNEEQLNEEQLNEEQLNEEQSNEEQSNEEQLKLCRDINHMEDMNICKNNCKCIEKNKDNLRNDKNVINKNNDDSCGRNKEPYCRENGYHKNNRIKEITNNNIKKEKKPFFDFNINYNKVNICIVENERELIQKLINKILFYSPLSIVSYENDKYNINYINQRCLALDIGNFYKMICKLNDQKKFLDLHNAYSRNIKGIIIESLYKLSNTYNTSFENLCKHYLNINIPSVNKYTLYYWYNYKKKRKIKTNESSTSMNKDNLNNDMWNDMDEEDIYFPYRHITIKHYLRKVYFILLIYDKICFLKRKMSFCKYIHVDLLSLINRGSQYIIESFLLKMCIKYNYVLYSPSNKEIFDQRPILHTPLILQPKSSINFFPLLVFDFQSLYPSILIAFNICYSTCLGTITLKRKLSQMDEEKNNEKNNEDTEDLSMQKSGTDVNDMNVMNVMNDMNDMNDKNYINYKNELSCSNKNVLPSDEYKDIMNISGDEKYLFDLLDENINECRSSADPMIESDIIRSNGKELDENIFNGNMTTENHDEIKYKLDMNNKLELRNKNYINKTNEQSICGNINKNKFYSNEDKSMETNFEFIKLGVMKNVPTISSRIKNLKSEDLIITSNNTIYVKKHKRKGICPLFLEDILKTRIMLKRCMGMYEERVSKKLNERMGKLKLILNVATGYIGANFSGRMPCVDISESIISIGRNFLLFIIEYIKENYKFVKILYGDTDSLFLLNETTDDIQSSFKLAYEILNSINNILPLPMYLNFEKIYCPSLLLTKKRYFGFSFKSENQDNPILDLKGVESIRSDQCILVKNILIQIYFILFYFKSNCYFSYCCCCCYLCKNFFSNMICSCKELNVHKTDPCFLFRLLKIVLNICKARRYISQNEDIDNINNNNNNNIKNNNKYDCHGNNHYANKMNDVSNISLQLYQEVPSFDKVKLYKEVMNWIEYYDNENLLLKTLNFLYREKYSFLIYLFNLFDEGTLKKEIEKIIQINFQKIENQKNKKCCFMNPSNVFKSCLCVKNINENVKCDKIRCYCNIKQAMFFFYNPTYNKVDYVFNTKLFYSHLLSHIRKTLSEYFNKIYDNQISCNNFIIYRKVKLGSYKGEMQGIKRKVSLPPQAIVARKMMRDFPNSIITYKEKVPYIFTKKLKDDKFYSSVSHPHFIRGIYKSFKFQCGSTEQVDIFEDNYNNNNNDSSDNNNDSNDHNNNDSNDHNNNDSNDHNNNDNIENFPSSEKSEYCDISENEEKSENCKNSDMSEYCEYDEKQLYVDGMMEINELKNKILPINLKKKMKNKKKKIKEINYDYYIQNLIIPPLKRMLDLLPFCSINLDEIFYRTKRKFNWNKAKLEMFSKYYKNMDNKLLRNNDVTNKGIRMVNIINEDKTNNKEHNGNTKSLNFLHNVNGTMENYKDMNNKSKIIIRLEGQGENEELKVTNKIMNSYVEINKSQDMLKKLNKICLTCANSEMEALACHYSVHCNIFFKRINLQDIILKNKDSINRLT
ncbi:putative DNA polymerase zeta catalytic subunit [Plasmodium gaboni]|uniref:DNA-directed DNA polymerase n=1 Tax=Plasmodium gaboni TaxID=647221 RepID=A0A151LLK9_9APIC|nr:putative DNA polymerase zeta catalytic subunit [Plasmodium gaboni]KYN99739.1 putative DNA polymerase zeta catalytic subunit [Plasmodium gaboni]